MTGLSDHGSKGYANERGRIERTSIGRTRIEGSCLGLWNLLDLSIQFTGGSLVESDLFFHASRSNSIQHTKYTYTITVSSIFGYIKGDFDVTHGTQVVDFLRLDLGNNADEIGGVAQVAVM